MIKVLHVLASNKYSGAENVACQIIQGFEKSENFAMAYTSPNGPIEEKLKELDVNFISMHKLNYSELKKVVDNYLPDIIHAHDFTASVISSLFSKKCIIISHLHNNPPWITCYGFKSIIYRMCINKFSKILTVSSAISNEYVFSKAVKKKEKLIGNPINVKPIISYINKNEKFYDIAFMGRLTEQKDPIRFVNIINNVNHAVNGLKVIMIGEGEMEKEIEKKINELDLQTNINMIGYTTKPFEYLNKAKILCMPSKWEGFGLACIEAQALGLPVLASPVGGLRELISKECGLICNSDKEFETEIINLLNDENYFKNKSMKAVEHACDLDNYKSYIRELSELYISLRRSSDEN